MIKKLTLSFFIIFCVFFGATHALATGDLIYTNDTTVTINSYDYTIVSGSEATSVTVGDTTLTVVVPSGSTFTFSSPNRHSLANDAGLTQSCTSSSNSVTITGARTVVFTPVATGCVVANTGSSSGSYRPGYGPKATLKTPSTIPTAPTTLTTKQTYNLGTTTLKRGSKGEVVKELQRFLNVELNLGLVVDGKLGPKTIAVIKKWQKAHGLVVDGLVGPKTKAKMHASIQ